MLTHAQIWAAIDRLAARAGLSASGLAKRAGLDPTTFNKSKRVTREGRERWPSTESVAKSLAATGVSLDDFVGLISERTSEAARTLPVLALALATGAGHFDQRGQPLGQDWEQVALPMLTDTSAYALRVAGEELAPTYRDGAILVISPVLPPRRGDRVVLMTRAGELMLAELRNSPGTSIDVRPLAAGQADRALAADDVAWMARIVWASQ
jgi:phage repressor protein C with HTH and peptisase S24 domain